MNQSGTADPLPLQDPGWGLEISLDLDMVSAACPNCRILLVEANSADLNDLGASASTFGPARLYRKATPSPFYDVTSGANVPGQMASTCLGDYLCTGLPGYDGPTGLGTPHTEAAF